MGRGRDPRDFSESDRRASRDAYDNHDDHVDYDEYGDGDGDWRDDAAGDDGYGYTGERLGLTGEGALAPIETGDRLPAVAGEVTPAPVVIHGTGVSMGNPFIKRRERPLTLRIAVVTLTACILVTGLFAVTPLGLSAEGGNVNSFQALSGAVLINHDITYHWYTAKPNDTIESIANEFHVQIGGIYEINNMYSGEEINVGATYKIPDDPYYGRDFRAPAPIAHSNGSTVFGNCVFCAVAGTPPPESPCAPDGNGDPLGYHLVAPNPHSTFIRGFSWYHNGVDLAAPEGNTEVAAQAGQVIWAGWDFNGFGYSVKINHCHGLATSYGHMDKVTVTVGQFVQAGAPIGLEGSTGWSTGPHCHFMVWVAGNQYVDPWPYYGSIQAITGN